MSNDRRDGGEFAPRVTDSDVVRALREYQDPVATARELAEVIEVSSETVRRHLTELHEQGRVERKDVGARAVVWWMVEENGDADTIDPDDEFWTAESYSGGEEVDVADGLDAALAEELDQ